MKMWQGHERDKRDKPGEIRKCYHYYYVDIFYLHILYIVKKKPIYKVILSHDNYVDKNRIRLNVNESSYPRMRL